MNDFSLAWTQQLANLLASLCNGRGFCVPVSGLQTHYGSSTKFFVAKWFHYALNSGNQSVSVKSAVVYGLL